MGGNKPQDVAAKSVESGFSENELDDIMAEFASLDKELSGELESIPVAEAVEETAPVEEVAAEANPLDEMVAETNPLDEMVAETNPLDEMVAETNPLDEMVAETNPLDEMVAETNPLDEMVAETNPLDEIVAEADPVDELSSILGDELPVAEIEEPVEEAFEQETSQIVAQEDIEEVVAQDATPSLEEAFTEGFDEAEMDAIMKDLEEIDAASPSSTLEIEEESVATTTIKDEDNENVLVINQAPKETAAPSFTQVAPTSADSGEVAFSAAGNMNFNVNLTIAGSQATLSVVDGRFTLTMNGVDVSITEEGFKACIEGGANFNIPLPTAEEAKKVA